MSNVTVEGWGFEKAFDGLLDDFSKEVSDNLKAAVRAGGKKATDTLQQTKVPGATGEYASGWKMKTESDGYGGHACRVYNDKKPSLTHLLEFGHEKWVFGHDTGERVPAYPHIETAYEAGVGELLRRLEHG